MHPIESLDLALTALIAGFILTSEALRLFPFLSYLVRVPLRPITLVLALVALVLTLIAPIKGYVPTLLTLLCSVPKLSIGGYLLSRVWWVISGLRDGLIGALRLLLEIRTLPFDLSVGCALTASGVLGVLRWMTSVPAVPW
ncbi:hypothetical protein [Methanopyrus kandleri]